MGLTLRRYLLCGGTAWRDCGVRYRPFLKLFATITKNLPYRKMPTRKMIKTIRRGCQDVRVFTPYSSNTLSRYRCMFGPTLLFRVKTSSAKTNFSCSRAGAFRGRFNNFENCSSGLNLEPHTHTSPLPSPVSTQVATQGGKSVEAFSASTGTRATYGEARRDVLSPVCLLPKQIL